MLKTSQFPGCPQTYQKSPSAKTSRKQLVSVNKGLLAFSHFLARSCAVACERLTLRQVILIMQHQIYTEYSLLHAYSALRTRVRFFLYLLDPTQHQHQYKTITNCPSYDGQTTINMNLPPVQLYIRFWPQLMSVYFLSWKWLISQVDCSLHSLERGWFGYYGNGS